MSRPKISIGSWAFSFGPFEDDPWSFAQVLDYAAETGYDGVEINGFHPHPHPDTYGTPEKCRELLKEIEGHGLGISGYAPDFTETPPDQCDQEDYLKTLRKCIAFCKSCNIRTLRVDTVSPPAELAKDVYNQRFARLAATWHAAAEEASKEGMTVVWEFEPGFWLNKPSEVLAIAQAVGHEAFKILFDTSHAYMGAVIAARQTGQKETLEGGVAEYGRKVLEYIGHFHLIDSDGTLHNEETSTHTAFGKGTIDFNEALTAIKPAVQSLPWWCVDYCFNPEGPVEARKAVAFVQNLMEETL